METRDYPGILSFSVLGCSRWLGVPGGSLEGRNDREWIQPEDEGERWAHVAAVDG